jgi:hypothetical protein
MEMEILVAFTDYSPCGRFREPTTIPWRRVEIGLLAKGGW